MIYDKLNVREFRESDVRKLEAWRRLYMDAHLEIPMGYVAPGVETAIAEFDGEMVAALTARQAVVLDPLIRNPHFTNGAAMITAIIALERALAYNAQKAGAVEGYIAVPEQLTEYHKIVQRAGYEKTIQACVAFRRPFRPDTIPLLEHERAKVAELMASQPVEEAATKDVELTEVSR